jgi:hypothetical protein
MSSKTVYDEAQQEFLDMVRDLVGDVTHWFSRLSDVERLVGLAAFILMLFLLVLVKASTREHVPGKTRNFAGSFVLVVTFSFLVGMLLDTPYDPRNFLNEDFIRNIV